jgi:hypothetical protein
MNTFYDLLDVDTWAQLRKAQPKMTVVPFDAAQAAVRALEQWIGNHSSHTDLEGKHYWSASLKELIDNRGLTGVLPSALGRVLRQMGLMLWREANGYHVAWSEEQFEILKNRMRI